MIPDEEDIREYAKHAARMREIVQEEIGKSGEKIDLSVLNEITRSATMPIGIWIEQKAHHLNHNGNHKSADEAKKQRWKWKSCLQDWTWLRTEGMLDRGRV